MPPWASMVLPLVSFQTAPGAIHVVAKEPVAVPNKRRRRENNILELETVDEENFRE